VPQGKVFYGIDFGYNDPTVCVKVTKVDQAIYIEQVFFRTKMLIKDIAEELHAIGVHKVYADNEPRTIKELRNRGIRIKPAKKGKDSIRQGLGFIRTHQIFIHEEALETIKEFREYKYKLDDQNDPTDEPLDLNNHSVDATRYALSYALRGAVTIR
jgi:phage terminase large subunit